MELDDFEIFTGKSFKDLCKDIVNRSDQKKEQIEIIIGDLRQHITSLNDALVMAPIIREYIDSGVKNDEQLIRLAGVLQRIQNSMIDGENGTSMGLSSEEKEQLMREIKDTKNNVDEPVNSVSSSMATI